MARKIPRDPPDPPAGKGRGPIVLILAMGGLMLAAAVFYWRSPQAVMSYFGAADRASDPVREQREIRPMIDLGEFIVNLIGEDDRHYLKTSMTIELSSGEAAEEMSRRRPQIRDSVLMLISNKTFEELYDLHGKKQLKAELILQINEILTSGEAAAVYFTDFVVQ